MSNEEQRHAEELRRIGYRLRDLRNQRGMSLRALSELTGLSLGYLSQLENGKAIPSLQVMLKLSDTFNKSLPYFFERHNSEQPYLYFPLEDQIFLDGNGNRKLRILTPGEQLEIEPVHVELEPGGGNDAGLAAHEGWEFLYVIKGNITLHLGDRIVQCKEGDAICYNSMIPHMSENTGTEPAVGLWIGFKRKQM
ncbi:helix-turn-helix domain-containing protein [Brevibacillus sp. B_LB10_24]|uniref:helix-turn-helix domain-containing protein n=1 Tax=Brevibacillus sp. B_LB10_24 TaxID=3380645 RepID=UPI0038BADED1